MKGVELHLHLCHGDALGAADLVPRRVIELDIAIAICFLDARKPPLQSSRLNNMQYSTSVTY